MMNTPAAFVAAGVCVCQRSECFLFFGQPVRMCVGAEMRSLKASPCRAPHGKGRWHLRSKCRWGWGAGFRVLPDSVEPPQALRAGLLCTPSVRTGRPFFKGETRRRPLRVYWRSSCKNRCSRSKKTFLTRCAEPTGSARNGPRGPAQNAAWAGGVLLCGAVPCVIFSNGADRGRRPPCGRGLAPWARSRLPCALYRNRSAARESCI